MIPYFSWTTIPLGPFSLQVWGLFVALGILLALWVGRREALRRGLNPDAFLGFGLWILVGAFLAARLFHVFVYNPAYYLASPAKIVAVWEGGLSSFGGFLGALAGAVLYWFLKNKKAPGSLAFVPYAESVAYALPLGYGCGRIGCFLIHDHPGTLSDSLLAVRYPGGARLDHGLLLSLLGFSMFGIFWLIRRRQLQQGSDASEGGLLFLPLFLLLYGAVRFLLDFFRAADLPGSDARYFGFTPAQYGCVLFIMIGVGLLAARRSRQRANA